MLDRDLLPLKCFEFLPGAMEGLSKAEGAIDTPGGGAEQREDSGNCTISFRFVRGGVHDY